MNPALRFISGNPARRCGLITFGGLPYSSRLTCRTKRDKTGVNKFSTVVDEFRKLHKELIRHDPNPLRPPGMESFGIVAKGIMFFLSRLPDGE
jgi:hypothetical protein